VDNDLSGDPDGLFQLAQHLRSPSVDIRAIIGSHLHEKEPFDPSDRQAANAADKARELLALMGLADTVSVIAGVEKALATTTVPTRTPATDAIIAEALRDDPRPLYYCAGAGLTDLAMALLIEPRIAKKLTLVWIGGAEHPGLAVPPPGAPVAEYNLTIDRVAAQVVFNQSAITIWQVPRNAYRQLLVSNAELQELKRQSALGAWLVAHIEKLAALAAKARFDIGETYILGDSPLVTLTALQSSFEPDPSSSEYVTRPAPNIRDDGSYQDNPQGRPMRIYTRIDTRLTFADMALKLR
jgi:inosine-uridine nucleoside N-ribohydrolase